MAHQLIDALAIGWQPEGYRDVYQEKVAALITAKQAGETVEKAEPAPKAHRRRRPHGGPARLRRTGPQPQGHRREGQRLHRPREEREPLAEIRLHLGDGARPRRGSGWPAATSPPAPRACTSASRLLGSPLSTGSWSSPFASHHAVRGEGQDLPSAHRACSRRPVIFPTSPTSPTTEPTCPCPVPPLRSGSRGPTPYAPAGSTASIPAGSHNRVEAWGKDSGTRTRHGSGLGPHAAGPHLHPASRSAAGTVVTVYRCSYLRAWTAARPWSCSPCAARR